MAQALNDEWGYTEMNRAVMAGAGMQASGHPDDAKLAKWFYWKPTQDKEMSVHGYHVDPSDKGPNPERTYCTCTDDDGSFESPAAKKLKAKAIADGIHIETGRAIFKDVVYVHIQKPGDRDMIVDTEAWISPNPGDMNAHNNRFPAEWKAFLERKGGEAVVGTPLEALTQGANPILKASQVEEFKFCGVKTVEQLLNVDTQNAQKFQGFSHVRARVADYMKASQAQAPKLALQKELEARDAKIAHLEAVVEQMRAQLGDDAEDEPKSRVKRGRTAKSA